MARAYLDIVRVQLHQRLTYDIDLSDEARNARLPVMMLLPLVEQALRGLQAADSVMSLHLSCTVVDGRLRLTLAEHGGGLALASVDVAGIGERLRALYGDTAHVELQRVAARGTRVTLEIPYEDGSDSGDRRR